jgi:hypothetical protein
MIEQTGDSSGLAVELNVPETAVLGVPVPAVLCVRNRGKSALNVSTRLNLMEGDVRLSANDPGGTRRLITGAGGSLTPPYVRSRCPPAGSSSPA